MLNSVTTGTPGTSSRTRLGPDELARHLVVDEAAGGAGGGTLGGAADDAAAAQSAQAGAGGGPDGGAPAGVLGAGGGGGQHGDERLADGEAAEVAHVKGSFRLRPGRSPGSR